MAKHTIQVHKKQEGKSMANTSNVTKSATAITVPFPPDPTRIVKLPLRLALAEQGWNGRSVKDLLFSETNETSEAEKKGLIGLQQSIQATGQDEAITVRLNPNFPAKDPKHPYLVVEGFRRHESISRIAKAGGKIATDPSWNPLEPTIDAVVVEMTENEAIELNGRENLSRENLSPPDAAYVIQRIAATTRKTDVQIAESIGKTQGYVSKLHRAANGLSKTIFQSWRESPIQLGIDDMLKVVKMKSDELQQREYDRLLDLRKPKSGRAGGADSDAWVEGAKDRGKTVAILLAKLEADNALEDFAGDGTASVDSFERYLTSFVKGIKEAKGDKPGATPEQKREIARFMHAAYEGAFKAARAPQNAAADTAKKSSGKPKKTN